MNRFERGMVRLIDRLSASALVSIVYTRPDGSTFTPVAWIGRTAFRRNASDSVAGVVFSDRDYLIPVAELVESGAQFEPAEGDTITENGVVYRITAPDGEPAVRHSDQTRKLWRIHTKRVDV